MAGTYATYVEVRPSTAAASRSKASRVQTLNSMGGPRLRVDNPPQGYLYRVPRVPQGFLGVLQGSPGFSLSLVVARAPRVPQGCPRAQVSKGISQGGCPKGLPTGGPHGPSTGSQSDPIVIPMLPRGSQRDVPRGLQFSVSGGRPSSPWWGLPWKLVISGPI